LAGDFAGRLTISLAMPAGHATGHSPKATGNSSRISEKITSKK
jgi:hypothetical protein